MRRPVIAASIAALILLGAAVAAGFLVARSLGPEQIRRTAERTLARALGGEVAVASARLVLGAGVALEASDLRAWSDDHGPGLEVARAAAEVDPLSLLLGRVRLRRIVMEQATLRVERRADGRITPAPVVAAVLGSESAAREPQPWWNSVEELGDAARALLQAPIPLLRAALAPQRIELREARFVLVDEGGAEPRVLALEDFTGFLEQDARGRAARIGASGRLVDARGECGRVALHGARDRRGSVRLALEATAVDLRAFASYASDLHPDLRLGGLAGGRVEIEVDERDGRGARRLRVDLLASDLRLDLPRSEKAPLEIRGSTASASAELDLTPRRLRVRQARLDVDGQEYALDGVAERPLKAGSMARVSLRLDNVDLGDAQRFTRYLPRDLERRFSGSLAAVESGVLTELEVVGRGKLAGWQQLASPGSSSSGVHLEGRARFEELSLRTGASERTPPMTGELRLARQRLELRDLRTGGRFPRLDVTLEGLDHLPARAVHTEAPAPPRLAGLSTLLEVMQPKTPVDRRRTAVELQLDWLVHPRLGFPLRDVRAEVGPEERGVRAVRAQGLWGGVPAEVTGRWWAPEAGGPGNVRMRVVLSAPGTAPEPVQATAWARGTWKTRHIRVVRVPLARASGGFYAEGGRLRLVEANAPFAKGGRLVASLALDLDRSDAVPIHVNVAAQEAPIRQIGRILRLRPGALTGRLDGVAELDGSLRPGVPEARQLHGTITLHARDALLHDPPSFSDALAKLGSPFDRMGEEPLPFRAIQGDFVLEDGVLRSEALVMDLPGVRVVGSGQVRVDGAPNPMEAVVGVFPERRVDAIARSVPVLGSFFLGPDDNLMGLYLQVEGPWRQPQAEVIRGRTLASGPASFMVEGVPNFVKSGVKAIRGVLPQVSAPAETDAQADDS